MKKSISIALVIFSFGFIAPEERTITGKVTAADDGKGLPGVSVVLKNSNSAATTDAQGSYLLKIPAKGGILVFSFIGMKTQEIKTGVQNRIDVTMQLEVNKLQEVVVTGYGLQGKAAGVPKLSANAFLFFRLD